MLKKLSLLGLTIIFANFSTTPIISLFAAGRHSRSARREVRAAGARSGGGAARGRLHGRRHQHCVPLFSSFLSLAAISTRTSDFRRRGNITGFIAFPMHLLPVILMRRPRIFRIIADQRASGHCWRAVGPSSMPIVAHSYCRGFLVSLYSQMLQRQVRESYSLQWHFLLHYYRPFDVCKAEPTLTHMALVELVRRDVVRPILWVLIIM